MTADTKPSEREALDRLFRDNAIPMSDANARLYDTLSAAIDRKGQAS